MGLGEPQPTLLRGPAPPNSDGGNSPVVCTIAACAPATRDVLFSFVYELDKGLGAHGIETGNTTEKLQMYIERSPHRTTFENPSRAMVLGLHSVDDFAGSGEYRYGASFLCRLHTTASRACLLGFLDGGWALFGNRAAGNGGRCYNIMKHTHQASANAPPSPSLPPPAFSCIARPPSVPLHILLEFR